MPAPGILDPHRGPGAPVTTYAQWASMNNPFRNSGAPWQQALANPSLAAFQTQYNREVNAGTTGQMAPGAAGQPLPISHISPQFRTSMNPGRLPTTLAEFQRGMYGSPESIAEITNHPQGPLALQYQAYLADQEFRNAGKQQLQDVLGVLYRNRDEGRRLLQGAGTTALNEATRSSQERVGAGEQSLIGRGLYNTTALDSMRRGEGEALDRTRGAIHEDIASRRIGLDQSYALPIAQTIGSVQHEGPQYGLLADLLRAKMTPSQTGGWAPLAGIAGGGIGAAIGGFAGGPAGAMAGYGIGSGIGSGLGSYIR